jgi:ribosomal protein S15P/S13E
MGKKSVALAQVDAILSKGKKKSKGKKGRKIGRYSKHPSSQRYKSERRWLTNKVKRIEKHTKRFPNDKQSLAALRRIDNAA